MELRFPIELDEKARNERWNYENASKIFNQNLKDIDSGMNISMITLKQDFETVKQTLEDLGEKLFSKLKKE